MMDVSTQLEQVERRFAQEKIFAQAYTLFGGLALLVWSYRALVPEFADVAPDRLSHYSNDRANVAYLAAHLDVPMVEGNRIVERLDRAIAKIVVGVADSPRKVRIVNAEAGERQPDHFATGPRQLEAAHPMPFGIRPVPLANPVDGV